MSGGPSSGGGGGGRSGGRSGRSTSALLRRDASSPWSGGEGGGTLLSGPNLSAEGRAEVTSLPTFCPKRDLHERDFFTILPPSAECKLSAPAEEVETRLSVEACEPNRSAEGGGVSDLACFCSNEVLP